MVKVERGESFIKGDSQPKINNPTFTLGVEGSSGLGK